MNATTFDEFKRLSRHVTEAQSRVPQASRRTAHDVANGAVSPAELDKRRKVCKAPASYDQVSYDQASDDQLRARRNYADQYADQIGPARNGAVTHAGGKADVVCDANI